MHHLHIRQIDKSLRQPHVNHRVPRPMAIEGYPERAQRSWESMTHIQLLDVAKSLGVDPAGLSRAQLLKQLDAAR